MYLLKLKVFVFGAILQFCFISTLFSEPNSMESIATEESIVQSCSLSVKVKPQQPSPADPAAKIIVEVTVLSRDGTPVQGNTINLTATSGTFLCTSYSNDSTLSTSANSDDKSCFITNTDGKTIITLVNVPFNTTVKVKASTECGDFVLTSSGSAIVTKKTVKKKK